MSSAAVVIGALRVNAKNIVEFTNSEDPEKMAYNKLHHQNLHCLFFEYGL